MNNTEFKFMLTMLRTLLKDAMEAHNAEETMRLLKRIDDLLAEAVESKK